MLSLEQGECQKHAEWEDFKAALGYFFSALASTSRIRAI
jgi:hypothetical protein